MPVWVSFYNCCSANRCDPIVIIIVIVKSGVGSCAFERVGFCELEVALNWSEG